jgi:transcriptional regulator with XRE-family HTH domain
MTLDQYLAESGLTETDFAELIGTTQPNINRLRKGQVPSKELMAAIYDKTGGAVRADDFFGIGDAA